VIFFELFRQRDIFYQSIYVNQNVVIVNINRNTKDLLFKSLFFVYCFVDHFRLLVPFFHLIVVLSISLKEQFEDTKNRKWKDGHYKEELHRKLKVLRPLFRPLVSSTFLYIFVK
jgi:hypothetical protein